MTASTEGLAVASDEACFTRTKTGEMSEPNGATFGPGMVLRRLQGLATAAQPAFLPPELPWNAIRQEPDLFQPRPIDERHISELVRAIGVVGKLDAVTVIQVGAQAVLIEGHHRMAAYRRAGVVEGIPVEYFAGGLEAAVLESGRANSKAKLPMTNTDRQNCAWRLVQLGRYSRMAVSLAAGVGTGQVAIMRRVLKDLGEDALSQRSWNEARRAVAGVEGFAWSEDEVEAQKEAQAQSYADRLTKTFGNKLATNPEIAARALDIHLGRRLGEVFREMGEFVGAPEGGNDDF